MPRVDYDQIAHLYDEPSRDHGVDPHLVAYLAARPALEVGQARLLDVSCGTGKQLSANRARFPHAFAAGLDRYAGMLRLAHRRGPDLAWVQGDGAALPFRGESFDFATNQFAYAHVTDKSSLARELYRVLRPGGRFVLTNIDPWSMQGWHLYRFFPEARDLDFADFLPGEQLLAFLQEAGFRPVQAVRDHRRTREDVRAFLEFARERHRTSHFLALADEAYRAGMERIQGAIAAAGEGPLLVDSEFCRLTITADKPPAVGAGGPREGGAAGG
ncbi:MAG TPA: methyltransferase domain-containing protein [Chloroflexota bacterium]|nr:methyltransferase domain-containing protein [Chloroflexota bacterium]